MFLIFNKLNQISIKLLVFITALLIFFPKYVVGAQDQATIQKQLEQYLEKHSSKDDEFIKRFAERKGFCMGLTTLWLYSKWIDTLPETAKDSDSNWLDYLAKIFTTWPNIMQPKVKKYGYYWFKNAITTIAQWNGKTKPNDDDSYNFELFVSLGDFFQEPTYYRSAIAQHNVETTISLSHLNTNSKVLKKVFIITAIFNESQLCDLLKNITYENELIFIHYGPFREAGGHSVVLFKNQENYYFYDPNYENLETQKTSINEIATIINSDKLNHYDALLYDAKVSPITISIFSFNEEPYPYPNPNELLTKLNVDLDGSALISAAYHGALESVIFFLTHGLTVDFKDKDYGKTPLIYVSQNGHIEVVKLLLEKKAKVDHQANDGTTSLIKASQYGHTEIVTLLLAHGAKINQARNDGTTPLMLAAQYRHLETLEVLLKNEAKIDQAPDNSAPPLILAAQNGYTKVAELLLKYGAKIDQTKNGINALMVASQNGHIETVELLLKYRAAVNQAQNDGITALMYASRYGHIEVLEALLRNGAKADLKNNSSFTALNLAEAAGHKDCVQFLRKKKRIVDEL